MTFSYTNGETGNIFLYFRFCLLPLVWSLSKLSLWQTTSQQVIWDLGEKQTKQYFHHKTEDSSRVSKGPGSKLKFASQPTTKYINIHHPQSLTYFGARMQMQFWFSIVETAGTLLTLPIPNILLSREYPVSTPRRWVVVVAKVTRCEVWGAGSVFCPLLYFISHILLLPKHSNKDIEKKPNTTNINCVIAALKQCWLSLNDFNDGMICRNHQ